MSSLWARAAAAAVSVAFAAHAARADDPSWTVTTPNSSNSNSGLVGTEFTPATNLTVTALGYYDDTFSGPDGLAASHPVGIYITSTQQLISSATVPAGTAAPKINHFRFVDITPVQLTAGVSYVIAAVGNGDFGRVVTPGSSMTTDPRLTTANYRIGNGSALAFPGTVITTTTRFMGPAFLLTTPATPPPPGTMGFTIAQPTEANSGSATHATEFTPAVAVWLTGLGYYDDTFAGAAGLEASHTVAIYRDGLATPLVTATVPAGSSAALLGRFRFVPVTPLRLTGGVRYLVAGTGTGDWSHNAARASVAQAAGITLGNWRYNPSTTLAYPDTTLSTTVLKMGSDFLFRPAACQADFDCDGDVGTDADIEAFFACLSGACPATPCTNTADFDGDGDVGTDADIEAFFRVLAGGPC